MIWTQIIIKEQENYGIQLELISLLHLIVLLKEKIN